MSRLLAAALTTAFITPLAAQDTFVELQQRFRLEAQQLGRTQPSRAERDALLGRHTAELQRFVDERAKGDDRWNARLMLADLRLAGGDREGAKRALTGIEAKEAPPLLLVSAAAMAPHAGAPDLRETWITAALARPAPLPDQLAIARLLMLTLHEIERGEAVFAKALAAAEDDETRALVRFHRADALRDREDLPDNAGFEELEKLVKELPATYWAQVGKDRLRAVQLKVGDAAIPFAARTVDGKPVTLATYAGKVLVLAFWVVDDRDNQTLWPMLQDLQKQHGERLAVLAVNLDRDAAAAQRAIADQRIAVPVVADGKGPLGDLALRWFAEGPALFVVDGQGKIAGQRLFVGTADGRAEFLDTVMRAVGR